MTTILAPQPISLTSSVQHLRPLLRLKLALASPENRRTIISFVSIGALSTAAYLMLYLALRTVADATAANFLAQLISTIGSTAANRRITFGITDHHTVTKHHMQMVGIFLFGLLANSGSLAMLAEIDPSANSSTELIVLVVSGIAATIVRIMVMRRWAH